MRKIDPDGVERFDARLPVKTFEQARMEGTPDNPLWAKLLGAGDYWYRHQSNAPGQAPPPAIGVDFGLLSDDRGRSDWAVVPAGVVFAATVGKPGRVSANVDDGASPIEVSADPSFPPGQTARAAGNSTNLSVPAGRVYGRHFGDYGGRSFQVRWDWSPDRG